MDLVKVHESHMRVLEGELAAHKATAHEAAQQEAALVREREGLALQGKHLAARLAEAHAQLDQKAREAAEVQATVRLCTHEAAIMYARAPGASLSQERWLWLDQQTTRHAPP